MTCALDQPKMTGQQSLGWIIMNVKVFVDESKKSKRYIFSTFPRHPRSCQNQSDESLDGRIISPYF